MTSTHLPARAISIALLSVAALALAVIVVDNIREPELPTFEWPAYRQHVTGMSGECTELLSDSVIREDGIAEFYWQGTQSQYDTCWSQVAEPIEAQQITLMIRWETRDSDAYSTPSFPAECGTSWTESPDAFNTYVWTGTADRVRPCMAAIGDILRHQEDLRSGNQSADGINFVIHPPE